MQRCMTVLIALLCLWLAGCATTIQSNVTAFHEWPAELRDKSFVFERTRKQDNNLEYRSYENLLRGELLRLGFMEAADPRSARLKVSMFYNISARDVLVVQPVAVDPWYGSPFYGPRWSRYGYYSPFYDPFWYGPPLVEQRETQFQLFTRRLKVMIAQVSDSRNLYDVTVDSEGSNGSLAAVMPYLVRSAFVEFPAANGVPRRVELKMQN
ncbi:MAG: hypothetical protein JWQ21_1159 [Herminiimonas sp.]|nr:hypothetical protein [Herminiimonas sp.]